MWLRVLALALAAAVTVLSLLNGRPIYIRVVFENDFAAHATAFLILTLAVLAAWGQRRRVVALLCLFAAGIELAQLLTPSRHLTASDLAGNLAGVLIGVGIARAVRSWRSSPAG